MRDVRRCVMSDNSPNGSETCQKQVRVGNRLDTG